MQRLIVVNAVIAYNVGMAVLNIRNLPEEIHRRLRLRAARAGRSMEAEAREILSAACSSDVETDLQEFTRSLYAGKGPASAVDDLLKERRREAAHD